MRESEREREREEEREREREGGSIQCISNCIIHEKNHLETWEL